MKQKIREFLIGFSCSFLAVVIAEKLISNRGSTVVVLHEVLDYEKGFENGSAES